nr:hypothetical protein [Bacillus sp. V3-13]
MNENLRNDIAAFRFGLIAQVVQRKLQPGERYALLREIAKQSYTIPGSERQASVSDLLKGTCRHMKKEVLKP